jgi:hypothetical protein
VQFTEEAKAYASHDIREGSPGVSNSSAGFSVPEPQERGDLFLRKHHTASTLHHLGRFNVAAILISWPWPFGSLKSCTLHVLPCKTPGNSQAGEHGSSVEPANPTSFLGESLVLRCPLIVAVICDVMAGRLLSEPGLFEIRAQRQASIKRPGPESRYYRYVRFHQARRARGPHLSPPEVNPRKLPRHGGLARLQLSRLG